MTLFSMSAGTAPAKILLVEDEAIIAMDLEQRLSFLGYEVTGCATRGDQALKMAESNPPDLALMDIHLQGEKDGIETAAAMRSRYSVPVVFLTAYSDDDTLRRAVAERPMAYLVKPFADREVHAAIELALCRERADREVSRYKRALEEKVAELEEALSQVRELSALLPICSWCKKIRNEDGYWEEVSSYISSHTNTLFTHSLCEGCRDQMKKDSNPG